MRDSGVRCVVFTAHARRGCALHEPELSMSWVNLQVGLSWVALGWIGSKFSAVRWITLGRWQGAKIKLFICYLFCQSSILV